MPASASRAAAIDSGVSRSFTPQGSRALTPPPRGKGRFQGVERPRWRVRCALPHASTPLHSLSSPPSLPRARPFTPHPRGTPRPLAPRRGNGLRGGRVDAYVHPPFPFPPCRPLPLSLPPSPAPRTCDGVGTCGTPFLCSASGAFRPPAETRAAAGPGEGVITVEMGPSSSSRTSPRKPLGSGGA